MHKLVDNQVVHRYHHHNVIVRSSDSLHRQTQLRNLSRTNQAAVSEEFLQADERCCLGHIILNDLGGITSMVLK